MKGGEGGDGFGKEEERREICEYKQREREEIVCLYQCMCEK